MKFGLQLYSLRALGESTPSMMKRAAAAGFDGVEFAGVDEDESVRAVLDETGLEAPAAHVPIEDLESDLDAVCERYGRLGVETLVVPYLPPEAFADADTVDETAHRLDDLTAKCDDRGVRLLYHNHEHEFRTVAGEPVLERVAAHSGIGFELDLAWILAAGYDPAEYVARYADRTPIIHLKDVVLDPDAERGGRPVALGEGELDIERCLAAAGTEFVEWGIVEHDDPDDPATFCESAGSAIATFRTEK
ncbi:sugar phosphate isomerase/epimerase [Haloferax mediterranei ATCC 33500]|uniref:Sugar phosphate isomerase/epimerase n=1 Tax=Haloferax mediterranei (strain ATCC 33500 / DSM 1411 / JCM 8866 / NBRC 14739 / NCIMB 2177 / R-4) TaxID=523841 RepID=I3R708_HALMT|nr:sugar phosphate isomerase/epimerase [Haloferax mediterranei]AFK20018.1 Xylose isomerase domain protein TIM barrel [Haloferax mediterranei ATCC 33500]ELZ99565.1 xylose isomerase domain-containing protein [Haloferax mediterranei ATCC 33500]MDX5987230.1 sugar phosphate isomerase/epimerase [Haloferax mediterranei ATCC 33500]QCQ73753.1 sugar phosphate isomerase/epimerase [Haloferax mediterranei ATCC 33500]